MTMTLPRYVRHACSEPLRVEWQDDQLVEVRDAAGLVAHFPPHNLRAVGDQLAAHRWFAEALCYWEARRRGERFDALPDFPR
jgi:hypothetical protein